MRRRKIAGIMVVLTLLNVVFPNHIKAATADSLFLKAKESALGISEYNWECDVNGDGNTDVFDVIRVKRGIFDLENSEDLSLESDQYDMELVNTQYMANNTTTPSVDNFNSESFDVFALKPIDDSSFNNSTASWWASEYHYKAGYVESIRLNPNSGAVPNIMIVDATDKKVVFKGAAVDNVVEVKQLIEHDFYVFVKGVKYSTMATQWSRYYEDYYYTDYLDLGSYFAPEFRNGGYIFAVEITYKNVNKDSLVLKKEGTPKMFVAGDSITAGYPYMEGVRKPYVLNEDIRWGRQVARRLGYDVTFGEQNGNGWVYSTGSANAYSITAETDFSQYDVVIYAWGTNDYAHGSALGDVDDNPSEKLTVCSRIKWAVNKIYSDNPDVVFILSLPLNRNDGNNHGTKDTNWAYGTKNTAIEPYTLSEMCDKMVELCEKHGIPYIDNRVSAFNRYSLTGLTTDGLHPNYKGYKIFGAHMTGEISRIITPYYPDALTEGNVFDY